MRAWREGNFDETLEKGKKSDNGGSRPIGTLQTAAATMTSIFRRECETTLFLLLSLFVLLQ